MSKKVTIQYLIDVAIGSPDPGVVNFNALYTLLKAMCEKLELDDEDIEVDSSFCPVASNAFDSKSNVSSEKLMDEQVYDNQVEDEEENRSSSGKIAKMNETVSVPDQEYSEERKVAFDRKVGTDESMTDSHGAKKPKSVNIRQHIDSLNERVLKLENNMVLTVETEQNVECLMHSATHLQNQIDSLEKSLTELKEKRHAREEDISACRLKLEYDKISSVIEDLQQELKELKDSLGKNPPMIQAKELNTTNPHGRISSASSKFETQLIEVKTTLCNLTDKIALLDENVMNITNTLDTLKALQSDTSNLKADIENTVMATLKVKLEAQQVVFDEIRSQIEDVVNIKMDKEEIEELLSEKADYTMLQGKVSAEIMEAEYRKLEKQITEISDCVAVNEEQIQKQIDDIKTLVGEESLKDMLDEFKLKTDKQLQALRDGLKKLSEIKPDVDSAMTRLKDLACLSCDQDVVMKTMELNNLSKLADAHVSKSINPSIAFEVGKLRQAGKMGLFYEDDPILEHRMRHSGGRHTIITKHDQVAQIKSHRRK